jgi:hypothetical protein
MKHPEVFIIPVLMLLDYYLTVWGAVLSEKKFAQHFKYEHYELNPDCQKSIAQKKWFDPKCLGSVAAVTAICLVWAVAWQGESGVAEGVFGFATMAYGSIVGRHLMNICEFRYFIRHPECVSGEVTLNHLSTLNQARFGVLVLFFPLMLIVVFSPSPFVIGGVCSQVYLYCLIWRWIAKAKAQLRKANTP